MQPQEHTTWREREQEKNFDKSRVLICHLSKFKLGSDEINSSLRRSIDLKNELFPLVSTITKPDEYKSM